MIFTFEELIKKKGKHNCFHLFLGLLFVCDFGRRSDKSLHRDPYPR